MNTGLAHPMGFRSANDTVMGRTVLVDAHLGDECMFSDSTVDAYAGRARANVHAFRLEGLGGLLELLTRAIDVSRRGQINIYPLKLETREIRVY